MELVLSRTYHAQGTNGQLLLRSERLCYTIELPWLNNQPQVSCIPEGRYELEKRYSTKFGVHLQVMNVPGRELILIHPANDALQELKGCIAPVLVLTGDGRGERSCAALSILKERVFPALLHFDTIFLNIQSKKS